MYQKSALTLVLLYLSVIIIGAGVCTKGIKLEQLFAKLNENTEQSREAFYNIEEEEVVTSEVLFDGEDKKLTSSNLEIEYHVIEKEYCISLSETDYDTLLRIVEAEAGGEDDTGKLLVANVVINRVKSPKFPNSIQAVVYQREGGVSQFTPVSDGRINTVIISDSTREVVEQALLGKDISQGALYFVNRKVANPDRMRWFDEHLVQLFCYGGHEFFL